LPDRAATDAQIDRNIAVHDRVAERYDGIHGEIFNDIEQARLAKTLAVARDLVTTGSRPLVALDFGCGSGNVTRHLLAMGCAVTAADVSQRFLDLVARRFAQSGELATARMNGSDLSNFPDDTFDLVATYSVLHHVPDYMRAVREMLRVCKPGGVVMLDHEPTEEYWSGNPVYAEFQRAGLRREWRKFLSPANYVHKLWRLFDPRHTNEGDIHVWPDDHVEWPLITRTMLADGAEIVHEEDYLLYKDLYRRPVYEEYVGRCSDTRTMIFRKKC